MRPETQQKIVTAIYRAWSELGQAVRGRGFSHSEGMQLLVLAIRANALTPEFLLLTAGAVIPEAASRAKIDPQKFEEQLTALDSEQKLEKFLSDAPEPSAQQLGFILRTIDTALPQLRKLFKGSEILNRLSSARGVKETDLTGHKDEICREIKRLRGLGVTLANIFERIAPRYDRAPKTIERIYYDECEHD